MPSRLTLTLLACLASVSLTIGALARSACPSSPEAYDSYDCSPGVLGQNVCQTVNPGAGYRIVCEGTSDEDEIYAVWDSTNGPFIWGNVGGLFCCDSSDLGSVHYELRIYLFQSDDVACAHLDGETAIDCHDYDLTTPEYWDESVHIFGGTGNDQILASNDSTGHDDELVGGDGYDWIYAYGGDDAVQGNEGRDQLHGGDGADVLLGGPGPETIYGGDGADEIEGNAGDDALLAGEGDNDSIWGGDGDDWIIGGDGADDIDGGDGADDIDGGDGGDCLCAGMDSSSDTLDGETNGADCYFDTTSTPNPDTYTNCTTISSNNHPTDPCGCL